MTFHITARVTFNETHEVLELIWHRMAASIIGWTDRWNLKTLFPGRTRLPAPAQQAAGNGKPHLARFLAEKDADPDIERLWKAWLFLPAISARKLRMNSRTDARAY